MSKTYIKAEGTTGSVAVIGVFDGVHCGHRFLLEHVRKAADERRMTALAVTFHPTPAAALGRSVPPALLTLDERCERLTGAGMDRVEVIPFTRALAAMTASQFMTLLKEQLGASTIVMGYDHRFGCEQRSDAAFYDATAAELGLEILHVPAYGAYSSTRIREALLEGRVEEAATGLGYPYFIRGIVVDGDKRGRTLGFPTANLAVAPEKLVPATGVYAVGVSLNGTAYKGMMNVGLCPTFGGKTERRLEVHILDFDADIYGETLTVQLRRRLRDEQRFPSVEALVSQLHRDAEEAAY